MTKFGVFLIGLGIFLLLLFCILGVVTEPLNTSTPIREMPGWYKFRDFYLPLTSIFIIILGGLFAVFGAIGDGINETFDYLESKQGRKATKKVWNKVKKQRKDPANIFKKKL